MSVRNLLIIGMILIAALAVSPVAAELSSLEEQMSQEEFERAGLDKLSSQELEFLNEWLINRKAMPKPAPAPAATAAPATTAAAEPAQDPAAVGFRRKAPKRVEVVSRIDGEFTGWAGRTQFKLENGQVWRQTDGKTFRHNATNPAVVIKPKSLGTWKLYVEGLNRSVKVERIK